MAALLFVLIMTVIWPRPSITAEANGPLLVRVSAASPYGNCAPAEGEPASNYYLNAEVEPRVAVNPATVGTDHVNVVGVWQQDRAIDGGAHGIVAASSFDGGRTWSETPIPFTHCTPGGLPLARASDPWVSAGPDGTVYASAISVAPPKNIGILPFSALAAVSHDGGRTWSNVQVVSAEAADKSSILADPTRPGTAYLVWNAPSSGVTRLSRTVDGGKTWSAAHTIKAVGDGGDGGHGGGYGHELLVDPRSHALYDVYATATVKPATKVCTRVKDTKHPKGRKRCKMVRHAPVAYLDLTASRNGGATWSKSRIIARVGADPAELGALVRAIASLPDAAIDPVNGSLHVVWLQRFAGEQHDGIASSSSSDGGRHWSRPVQINGSPHKRAILPSVAVNAQGVVGVTYYDFVDRSKPPTLPTNLWFVSSSDHGVHFGAPVHVAGPFDLTTAPNSGGYFLGDYQGLAVAGLSFVPFFVMANSNAIDNRTDVFSTSILP